ncbi:LOW QUALITY PROTEIN: elongator complex protein 5 [Drosophila gunungcola]|uniref:LOW QUALITY PROTEIN: elongator complex protein 5 n=1 Tax=Drosophila gunungcola TaxID=103775 RepID=UPI0022E52349|nr:LOW QUALITY PROTEIN: elongator complex protein 5 [Drosophila gunungcola]
MLSNLLVTKQKVVLVIDELNRERIAPKFIGSLLHEQGQGAETIKTLPTGVTLKHVATFEALITECSNGNNNNNNTTPLAGEADPGSPSSKSSFSQGFNVILPTLADLLCYQSPAFIFGFLNRLRRSEHVRRVFLWASPQHLQHPHAAYILAGCEYLAELVLRLETDKQLSLISRKPGGGVSNRRFACQVTKTQFQVTPIDGGLPASVSPSKQPSPEVEQQTPEPASSTFKIELDEDEVVARNALTLPYERTSEPSEGNIIYTPDADDDFDEEDPDEDLCI